ncbi:MAG: DUF2877 domain-containing protein [Variibacter sp.]
MAMPAIPIKRVGRCVADMLANGRGEVGAVFERSFYITMDGAWACLLPPRGGIGPLNAVLSAPVPQVLMQQLRVGQPVVVSDGVIAIGTLRCDFTDAKIWEPPAPQSWNATELARGLAALDALLARRATPREGFASLLTNNAAPEGAVAAATRGPMQRWQRALTHAIAEARMDVDDIEDPQSLLGLGPGLTPSGDDAIGGALIALHALECGALRDALWRRIKPAAATSTSQISFAHLQAAAKGLGHEALHATLNSLLRGAAQNLESDIASIDAIGHTSGWDALAGCVTALKAWLGARTPAVSDNLSERLRAAVVGS